MEEFIRTLTEQIRCVKAREGVAKELMDHIWDQAEGYEKDGMSHEEAMKEAVKEMGDPVAIGIELDHIHRPKTDWFMLFWVVMLSIAGVVIQYMTGVLDMGSNRLENQCLFTVMGLAAMFVIYFLDYSFIGKYAKLIYWGMMIVYFLYTNLWEDTTCGQARGMVMPSYLFAPIYAGILYQYRGQSCQAIVKSILYMIPIVFYCFFFIPSLPTAINFFFILGCMLLLAIWKGWFRLNKIKTMLCLLFVGVVFPLGMFVYMYHFTMADYQQFRIQSFFHILDESTPVSYIFISVRNLLADSKWIGASIDMTDSNYQLIQSNGFMITQLIAAYGMWIGIIVILAFIMLITHIFRIAQKQKNQLGYMIGSGCGLIFCVMVMEGIFVNFGWIPCTTICIPFLTYGGSATIFYDILLGLLLSVYRYQNVLSDKSFLPKWKLSLTLEKNMNN